VSFASGVAGLWIAFHHPLSPAIAVGAFFAWSWALALRPRLWLVLLPALLPVLGLAPWSGWTGIDEFDLAVLATAAGAYAAHARAGNPVRAPGTIQGAPILALVLGLAGLVWVAQALAHVPVVRLDWFDSYAAPLNILRIAKGLYWPLLLLPLLSLGQGESEGRTTDGALFASGMATGVGVVALAVLWERFAFTGLWSTEIYYRTTALFWEMHVGGAAIEVFLVLAMPFVVACVMHARSPGARAAAILLVVLAFYVCASTLSRSLYVALAASAVPAAWVVAVRRRRASHDTAKPAWMQVLAAFALVVCGAWLLQMLVAAIGYAGAAGAAALAWGAGLLVLVARPGAGARRWRACIGLAMVLILMLELGALREGASFLTARLERVSDDYTRRSEHWQRALSLLQSPLDWAIGRGLGRFPAEYASRIKDAEFPGAFKVVTQEGASFARLGGPLTRRGIAGVFGASQRVGPLSGGRYAVTFDARVAHRQPLVLSLCEKHLIYEAACAHEVVDILPGDWRPYAVPVDAGELRGGPWYAPRPVLFSVASAMVGGEVEVDNLRLVDAQRRDRLVNGDFSADAAHWFFTGRYYFLPWHADSLVVELMVERGLLGVLLFAWLMVSALFAWAGARDRQDPLSPYVVAALTGCAVLGIFSSVLDVPRNAFLLLLLCLMRPARKTAGAPDDNRPPGAHNLN